MCAVCVPRRRVACLLDRPADRPSNGPSHFPIHHPITPHPDIHAIHLSTYLDDFHNKYFPPTTDAWNAGTDENYPLMNASVQPDRNWPEERYWDARIAAEGVTLMKELAEAQKDDGQPWFLGVGFHQPHRPLHFPVQYWDLYDKVPIPATTHTTFPQGAPSVATGDVNPMEISLLPKGEKRYWADPVKGGVGLDAIIEAVRGYHASISFLDNQVRQSVKSGRVRWMDGWWWLLEGRGMGMGMGICRCACA